MADALKESLGRYMESGGEEYRTPAYLKKHALTSALRRKGIKKLKVKHE